MSEYKEAAKISDVPAGEGRVVEVDGTSIALFNMDGNFYAMDNTCLHRGGPLGEGSLEGTEVTCPWHGWTYDIKTGQCASAGGGVKSYAVKCEGESVLVEIE